MAKKEFKPNVEPACALVFIKQWRLSCKEIENRYTVKQIGKMCAELGLPIVDGENQVAMAARLHARIEQTY